MSAAEMKILPIGRNRKADTVTFEFEEREYTITGQVDMSGHVHEAFISVVHLDGPGQDPLDCTEAVRKSSYFMDKIVDFVSTYDWVSKRLAEKYSSFDKL